MQKHKIEMKKAEYSKNIKHNQLMFVITDWSCVIEQCESKGIVLWHARAPILICITDCVLFQMRMQTWGLRWDMRRSVSLLQRFEQTPVLWHLSASCCVCVYPVNMLLFTEGVSFSSCLFVVCRVAHLAPVWQWSPGVLLHPWPVEGQWCKHTVAPPPPL